MSVNKKDLNNKVAVITGAGSGIGRALALLLDQYGCRLALSDIDAEALQETVNMLKHEAFHEVIDVSDTSSVKAHADNIFNHFKQVDIVINNAGVDLSQFIQDVTFEDFHWLMNINFWGVVNGTSAFLKHMMEKKSGTIVNISSILGIIGGSAHGTYCASKFAVRGYTESLRSEMYQQKTGVNIMCVHPGAIATNIVNNSRFYRSHTGDRDFDKLNKTFQQNANVTADAAAEKIVQGIIKGKSRLLIGPDAWLFDKIQRLFPESYFKILNFLVGFMTKENRKEKRSGQ